MSTTTQRPTPMTDQMEASLAKSSNVRRYYAALAQMRLMEVERDESARQLEAMREAINEAAEAFFTFNDVGLCRAWITAKDNALAQLEHLKLIDAHLERLLAIAEKRTTGRWLWHWRDGYDTAPGSIFAMPREGHAYAVAMCPRYGKDHFSDDATFIASCAGNAEAGWRATRAAIAHILSGGHGHDNGEDLLAKSILAAFPLELIPKP